MKKIINCETGEVIERPLNDDELAQEQIDNAEYQASQIIKEAKADAKAAAQAKLATLGLTIEDLQALGL